MTRNEYIESIQRNAGALQQHLRDAYAESLHKKQPIGSWLVLAFAFAWPGEATVMNAGYKVSAVRDAMVDTLDPKAREVMKARGEQEQILFICRSLSYLLPVPDGQATYNGVTIDLDACEIMQIDSRPLDGMYETIHPDLDAMLSTGRADLEADARRARWRTIVINSARRVAQETQRIFREVQGFHSLPEVTALEIDYECSDHVDDYGEDVLGFSIKLPYGQPHPETRAQLSLIDGGLGRVAERIRDGLLCLANLEDFAYYPGSSGHITVSMNTGRIAAFEHTKVLMDEIRPIDPQELLVAVTEGPAPT